MKGLRNPSASEEYTRWRDLATSAMPYSEVRSFQAVEEPSKRKRISSEEELKRQVEKLQI
jgi:hypothetical protein